MKSLLSVALLATALPVGALEWVDSPRVGRLFEQAGVTGSFVVYDVAAQRLIGHDRARAHTRLIPASTFKIPHSVIGLSVGAVASVDEVLPYGGEPQPFEAWERDMGLREAITLSNVPIYQAMARRIGLKRMREKVAAMGYGNGEIGSVVDQFWLQGPLRISAVEQARFLARLAVGDLPFPQDAQSNVREIVRLESGADWALYGKTGWVNAPGPGTGWWVGWMRRQDDIHAFALNIDVEDPADAAKRVELGKACLQALGVL